MNIEKAKFVIKLFYISIVPIWDWAGKHYLKFPTTKAPKIGAFVVILVF